MMATVHHVTCSSGFRKFQADGFLFDWMYHHPWFMPQTVVKSGTIVGTHCTVNSHDWYLFCVCSKYRGCPESIQPLWISQELVAWPWCNLAASQRRPYCISMNSLSPMGLVSRQWDTDDWACVLCDHHIHNDQASRSASSRHCTCPLYSSHAGFFGKASHHPGLSAPPTAQIWLPETSGFPKANNTIEREEICECDSHTVHKLNQQYLTAEWLAPQDSDCSMMYSKVSSDWLPSFVKARWLVLEIFKMAEHCLDSRHTANRIEVTCIRQSMINMITFLHKTTAQYIYRSHFFMAQIASHKFKVIYMTLLLRHIQGVPGGMCQTSGGCSLC